MLKSLGMLGNIRSKQVDIDHHRGFLKLFHCPLIDLNLDCRHLNVLANSFDGLCPHLNFERELQLILLLSHMSSGISSHLPDGF